MINTKLTIRNLTANWVGHAASLVVMFFLSPFILHNMGVTEYSIWQLLTVLTGYMGILDLGVRASTGRYIILYLGKGQLVKVDETIRTGLGLYTALSGLILIAGVLLGFFFPVIFPSVPIQYSSTVSILLPVLAVNIWIAAIGVVLSSILSAYERFDLARGVDLIVLAIRTIGTILALKMNYGLIGLTIAVISANFLGLIINYYVADRLHPRLKLWPLMLKKSRVQELYKYGIGAFIIAVSVRILGQTDLLLVGNLINVDSVAVYSVGAMLVFYSGTFTKQIDTTYFPALQKAAAEEKTEELKLIVYKQVYLSSIVGILLYVGYIVFGKSFITLWMYEPDTFPINSVHAAAQVMLVLSCAKILLLLGSFSRNLLAATGHISFAAKMTIFEAVINLILSISFVVFFNLELIGIACGTLVSHLLVQTFILPHHACKKNGLSWCNILLLIGVRTGIAAILFMLSCFFIKNLFTVDSWLLFFLQIGIAGCCYFPIICLILPASDRKRFRLIFSKKFLKSN